VKGFDHHAKIEFVPAELVWAQAGANVVVNGEVIGVAGVVNDAVKAKFDFKEINLAGAELDFESLMRLQGEVVKIQPISRFPAIERDLSIITEEDVSWADIVSAVKNRPCDKLEGVRFVEIYRGKGVPDGKKSVTLSLCFRDEDGTLRHEDVDGLEGDIIKSLEETVKAVLRTA
jgi:phenylalanyl-tRNA synthetase beta chain